MVTGVTITCMGTLLRSPYRTISRSYRPPVIAFAGLTAATLILIGTLPSVATAQQMQGNLTAQDASKQGQISPQQNTAPLLSPVVQADIDRIAKALEAANAGHDPAKENQRADDNLKAQKDIAYWGMIVASIAVFEALITAIGVGLVGLTLRATRRAAVAAEGTLAEIKASGQKELRAYISVMQARVTVEPNGLISVLVELRNTGLSNASRFTGRAKLNIATNNDTKAFSETIFVINMRNAIIGPTASANFEMAGFVRGSPQRIHTWRAEGRTVFVWGHITFVDAFGHRRYFHFRRQAPFDIGTITLQPHRLGDRAN